jgi:hypothetical protein
MQGKIPKGCWGIEGMTRKCKKEQYFITEEEMNACWKKA